MNTLVTSDFRPDAEIWPFRACALKPSLYELFSYCELGYGADTRSTERISSLLDNARILWSYNTRAAGAAHLGGHAERGC